MKLQLQSPVKNPVIVQGFGEKGTLPSMLPVYQKMGMLGHNGLDYAASHGTPIYACHDGTAYYEFDGAQGEGVVLRTNESFDYDSGQAFFKSIYWHMCDPIKEPQFTSPVYKAVGFKPDQTGVSQTGVAVKAGDLIGYADNTGQSTGDHLHFGLKPVAQGESNGAWFNLEQKNGYFGAIDPTPYFTTEPSELKQFYDEMKYGQKNDDILKMQGFLKRQGFFTAEPTGYYGPITAQAVLAFQKANLSLSWYEKWILRGNVVGPRTLAVLNAKFF